MKKEEIKEEKPKTMADILPEGFFDNPKADAKVWMCLKYKFTNIMITISLVSNFWRVVESKMLYYSKIWKFINKYTYFYGILFYLINLLGV